MTYQPKADFLRVMLDRGFMQDCTDLESLDEALGSAEVPAYIGFDCTAASLHVGSLVQIMMLQWLQETGHKPIVLMGGGTSKVGDPSGRDEARGLLSDEQIAANMAGIRRIFARFVRFDEAGGNAVMVDNADWLDGLQFIPFLRDYGRHFSINRMLTFDSVRLRLDRDQSLSFLEFSYMLLQAYDFLELYRRTGCRLQMGGSDQWGNIVNGIDLTRRVAGAEVFGLTSPLITTAGGAKMGKTAQGAVWLNEEMLSTYDYWQYWRNTADDDVGRFLRLFTTLPLDEIARLEALEGQELNEAKKVLATEATKLAHGERAAIQAEQTAVDTFERGVASAYLPTIDIPRDAFDDEGRISVIQLFVRSGLVSSGKDAKRLIAEGGARLDDDVLKVPGLLLSLEDFSDGPVKLSAGKKRHALVRVSSNETN